jgi:glycosyltransferase involved in cell wall biosynthesis
MNIAIDTTPLLSGHAGRGVGIYTKELIEALSHVPDVRLTYFSKQTPIQGTPDAVHYPYFDPFFFGLPPVFAHPSIVTVHDLTPIVLLNLFPAGIRGKMAWQYQKLRLGKSRRIITDSVCSKNDVARIIGYAPEKIDAVHLAPSPFFGTSNGKPYRSELPKQYMMYVGDVNANKNIPELIEAFGKTYGGASPYAVTGMTLLLVGKSFLKDELPETRAINAVISGLDNPRSVIKTGYVPDEELLTLYKNALCLVQPSLYEGFGLPVLEAMLAGCPVVTTNGGSLPEIAGPSIITDPTPESLSLGFVHMMELSVGHRELMIDKGRQWAKKFTWEKTAAETVESYKKAIGGS